MPRSSFYKHEKEESGEGSGGGHKAEAVRAVSPRALSPEERNEIIETLNSERFMDSAPREVYATLLDEGKYLSSWRTMYRILNEVGEVRERRNLARHVEYVKPELLATKPCQLWSWDITKLRGAEKYCYYQLYVIIDVFSRYVVGWLLSAGESAKIAEEFIAETCFKEGIKEGDLTLHADRGSSMKSKHVAQLLVDLGVIKSHSRPHVSNDNPYSEAAFKTLKYRPGYPDRFGSIEDARVWAKDFFNWYNHEHHHMGIGLLTPVMVHNGTAAEVLVKRTAVLQKVYELHPERFVKGKPEAGKVPETVWINPPVKPTIVEQNIVLGSTLN